MGLRPRINHDAKINIILLIAKVANFFTKNNRYSAMKHTRE